MRYLLILLLSSAAFASGHYYKWTDERGQTHLSDTPPTVKPKGGYVEMNADGLVVKRFDADLSDSQRAEQERNKQIEREKQEISRRDRTLRATFSRTSEIDAMRDQEIEVRKARVQADLMRIEGANKRLANLQKQADRASKNKAPISEELSKNISEKTAELAALEENIKKTKQEMLDIGVRAEADKKRLVELVGPSAQK